jgi:hypothetical protein
MDHPESSRLALFEGDENRLRSGQNTSGRGTPSAKARTELRQLEASMAPLLLKLQQLSIDNMVMRERERMLGLVRLSWATP